MFIRFDTIPACDGQTGAQKDRQTNKQNYPSYGNTQYSYSLQNYGIVRGCMKLPFKYIMKI